MDVLKKRNLFLAVTLLLIVVIVAVSAFILAQGPRESSVEVLAHNEDGTMLVNDFNDGQMTIPYYDISTNTTLPQDFHEESNGTITYEGGESLLGINVSSQSGAIDWAQVKENGVDFA